MKKKIFTLLVSMICLLALVSCGGGGETVKTYKVTFVTGEYGSAVPSANVKEGEAVAEPKAPVWVNVATGEAKPFEGWYESEKYEGAAYDFSKAVNADLTLYAKWGQAEMNLAGGKEGQLYNFKYADSKYREQLAATLERWLIDKGISIPLYYPDGLVIYNERIQCATDEYVPLMGYGATYGSFSGEDNYRSTTTAFPSALNHLNFKDSGDSDVIDMVEEGLFTFQWNKDFSGFEAAPVQAEDFPTPVSQDEDGNWVEGKESDDNTLSRAWKVKIRKDLYWSDGTEILLSDFIANYKHTLSPYQANYRANSFYTTPFEIVNAEKYYLGGYKDLSEEEAWDKVGIKAVPEENAIIFVLTQDLSRWDFMYSTGSSVMGAVKSSEGHPNDTNTYEYGAEKDNEGHIISSKWGTIPTGNDRLVTSMAFSGEFMITYYEDEKEIIFERNPKYVPNKAIYHNVVFSKLTVTKVANQEAAWELFEQGKIDVAGVPTAKYSQYVNDPRAKSSPGATVFRLSINQASQEQLDGMGAKWKENPLMRSENFRWALYFGVNRTELAEKIIVTGKPCQYYVNNAYKVDGRSSVNYRNTDAAKQVASGLGVADAVDLMEETCGYSAADAKAYYEAALTELVNSGKIDPAVKQELSIELTFWNAASQVMTAAGQFIAEGYEKLFNSQTKYPNITFKCKLNMTDASTAYDVKQMTGNYDLGLAGIQGSALDMLGLFEVWRSADDNGLRLSIGVDTGTLENSILWDGMYWSYDAIVAAASGPVWVVNGVISNDYEAAVSDAASKMAIWNEEVLAKVEMTEAEKEEWANSYKKWSDKLSYVSTPSEAHGILEDFIKVCEEKIGKIYTEDEVKTLYRAGTLAQAKAFLAGDATEGLNYLKQPGYESYLGQYQPLYEALEAAIRGYEANPGDETFAELEKAYNVLFSVFHSLFK